MVLKLIVYVRNIIFFFYKPKILWNFDVFSDFFACFTMLTVLFYDIIVTSYVGCFYLFWYLWKIGPIAIPWYQLDVSGGPVFKFTGSGIHPLGKPCYRKRLGKTRVKHSLWPVCNVSIIRSGKYCLGCCPQMHMFFLTGDLNELHETWASNIFLIKNDTLNIL